MSAPPLIYGLRIHLTCDRCHKPVMASDPWATISHDVESTVAEAVLDTIRAAALKHNGSAACREPNTAPPSLPFSEESR